MQEDGPAAESAVGLRASSGKLERRPCMEWAALHTQPTTLPSAVPVFYEVHARRGATPRKVWFVVTALAVIKPLD
jgi:hypothetical protein